MPITPEARRRLADRMEARRTLLRLRWQDVADAGNISNKALYDARTGTGGISPLTQRGIEVGLQWPPGTVQRILDGGEPEQEEPEPSREADTAEPVPLQPAEDTRTQDLEADTLELAIRNEAQKIRGKLRDAPPGASPDEIFIDEPELAYLWSLTPLSTDERIVYMAVQRIRDRRDRRNRRRLTS